MKIKNRLLFLLGMISFSFHSGNAVENCKASHCSEVNRDLNAFCISANMAGKKYLVLDNGVACFCPCSCVVGNTRIALGNLLEGQAIQDIVEKKLEVEILNPLSSHFSHGQVDVGLSSPMKGKILRIVLENSMEIECSQNHVFLGENFETVSAKNINIGTFLQTLMGPMGVVKREEIDFEGDLYNIIVHSSSSLVEDHIIQTNGIYSGDWLLQANQDARETSFSLRAQILELYQIEQEKKR